MNARDELAATIKAVDIIREKGETRPHALRQADAVIAAGWRKDQYLTDDQLYSGHGDTSLPDDTFVESADGSVWRVEPDFGWDCVSEGSASLSGPARLLVLGGGQE